MHRFLANAGMFSDVSRFARDVSVIVVTSAKARGDGSLVLSLFFPEWKECSATLVIPAQAGVLRPADVLASPGFPPARE
jgi:hypothetical protein